MAFAGRRTITVLLVEDVTDARELLATLLELHDFRVITAASAVQALMAGLAADRIDVLLADVLLPDGDGVQVARSLRRHHPRLRTLFISGSQPPPLADGQAFLRKPARIAAILIQIGALVGQSAYGRAS